MTEDNWKHVGQLGDLKDTKYWFNKDIQTFKTSFKKTLSKLPVLMLISILLSLGINYWNNSFSLDQIFITITAMIPISFLGYFLFYVMVNKGYNIHSSGGGTVIDKSRNPKAQN